MPESVEGFFALIGAIVCFVVAMRAIHRTWQLGLADWWQAMGQHVARLYWSVPKRTLIVLPARAENLWWQMGEQDGLPCMQVVGDFHFTNISAEPVLIPKTHFVVYGTRYVLLPLRRRVEGTILVRQAQGYLFGRTDVPSREMTEGRAEWMVQPPIRLEGQNLKGRACFIDGYGNEHWTPMLTWRHKA